MKTKKVSPKTKGKKIKPDTIKSTPVVKEIIPAIVRMANMRTGRVVRMGSKAATLLSNKYPNEFKIL